MRIVLCFPVESRHIEQIKRVAPQAEVVNAGDATIADEIMTADVFCGHNRVPVPWHAVPAQGRLRWIQSSAAGLDHFLVPEVIESPIVVTSGSGLFANQVAEQTFALLLGLLRGIPEFYRAQQRKEFVRKPTGDLHGKTVGIVGFGGNGRRLAEILAAFGVRVLATDMFPFNKPDYVEALWHHDRLHDLLLQSQILILCVPLNDNTRGMIGAEQLSQLPPGAILVNVARGPVVVEADLVQALESGHLGGAGLDVTEIEPLPVTSRLWDHPRVLITPHVGAQSAYRIDTVTDFFCKNLQRFLTDQPLKNLVNKRLGFPVRFEI